MKPIKPESLLAALMLLVPMSASAQPAWPAASATASPPASPSPLPQAPPFPQSRQDQAIRTLSLEQALERVYRDNPGLWRQRQEQALWPSRVLQAGLGSNPELTFSGEDVAGSAAYTQDRFTQFTLGLAQTLVLGDKLAARVRLAQVQQQLAYWDYRLQLRRLGHEVYRAYVRLLILQSEQKLVDELLANARAQHALFEKAVAAGRHAPAVLLQSASKVKAYETEALRLDLQARSQRQSLSLLWGGVTDFEQLVGEPDLSGWGDWAQLEQRLERHPRLARWTLESRQRSLALESARAQSVPDLAIGGGLRYHPPLDWGLVLSLGVPLPFVSLNQGQLEEARLRNESWQLERDLEARSLRGELRQAYDQAQGLAAVIASLREQVSLAQQQVEAAGTAFAAGRTGSLELLLAAQNLEQLRRALAAAQGERLLAAVEVLALTRELLPEPDPVPTEANDDLRR